MKSSTKLVKQRNSSDCGVACLAMFLNKSYEEIEGCIQFTLKRKIPISGMNNVEIARILLQYAHKPMQLYTMMEGVPSIISVPSLGTKKMFHFLYFDGKNIFDPARGYEKYSMSDFVHGFPLSDSIICQYSLEELPPTHFYNFFDWERINE